VDLYGKKRKSGNMSLSVDSQGCFAYIPFTEKKIFIRFCLLGA